MSQNFTDSWTFKIFRWLDAAYVFLVCKAIHPLFPDLLQKTIEKFGDIEDDSVWQIYYLVQYGSLPAGARPKLFSQILEEVYHANEFYFCLLKNGFSRQQIHLMERKFIAKAESDVAEALAYFFIGEAEAAVRFSHFARFTHLASLRTSLLKIIDDEKGHVDLNVDLAKVIGQDSAKFDKLVRSAFWKRRRQALLSALKGTVSALSGVLLTLMYFTFGWFYYPYCKRRINTPVPRPSCELKYLVDSK